MLAISITDDKADLTDQHVKDHGRCHPAEPPKAVIEAPQRAQADPFLADRDGQHSRLGKHPKGGTDA